MRKMVRRADGRPWFIHGVGFDITDLKHAEEALQEERNFASAVLDTVGALVLVLDPRGPHRALQPGLRADHRLRFRRSDRQDRYGSLLAAPEKTPTVPRNVRSSCAAAGFRRRSRARGPRRQGARQSIAWSSTALTAARGALEYVILTGIDVTEAKRLERTILEISGREQRRIGQDLHDGLGQHLTGVAFMSKVLEQKLREKGSAGGGRGGQDCGTGEPGDRQDAGAVARSSAGAFGRARADVCAGAAGAGGGGSVPGFLPVRMRPVRF